MKVKSIEVIKEMEMPDHYFPPHHHSHHPCYGAIQNVILETEDGKKFMVKMSLIPIEEKQPKKGD